jgi:hypothetical protein
MKIRNDQKGQRILARLTAVEISLEDLARARGSEDDNRDVGCGCGTGASTASTTLPWHTEDT